MTSAHSARALKFQGHLSYYVAAAVCLMWSVMIKIARIVLLLLLKVRIYLRHSVAHCDLHKVML